MSDEKLININLIIADRPYPLKIKIEEEEIVRKAAKFINEKVRNFQNSYAAKDKQDYLAMTALMYAVDALNLERKGSDSEKNIDEKLTRLDRILSKE